MYSQPWNQNLPKSKSEQELTLFDYQKAFNEYWAPYKVENGKYVDKNGNLQKAYGWKQFKRWEEFWRTRVNAKTGEFPATNTYLEYQKIIDQKGNYKSGGNWTCLGTNTSPGGYAGIGRINSIAFHPTDTNTFWIGAPAGGLWGTTDAGNTWTVLTDSNGVLGVSAIGIPSDFDVSQTIYIGTGDRDASDNYSIGILKSTDAGLNWDTTGLVFSPASKAIVNKIIISPKNDSILFTATTLGFYISTDAANSFTKTTNTSFIDFELCPGSPDTIFSATKGGDIFKSIDGGQNWTQVYDSPQNARIELAVSADNPAIVYALAAANDNGLYAILKSTDYGENFSIVYNDANLLGWSVNADDAGGQGWYDLSLATDPNNSDIVYLGGVNTWKSVDGGSSWTISSHWSGDGGIQAVHADKHYLAYQNNRSTLFECNDGGVYVKYENNNNWTFLANGLTISQIYGLGTAQTVPNETIIGLQDNGTKLDDDGVWSDVLGGDGMLCKIDYTDENIQYGSSYYGYFFRTTDEWENATYISSQFGGTGNWVTPIEIDPLDHNTIYIGYNKLWKSTDMGDNYTSIGNFSSNLDDIAICPTDNKTIYASTGNSLSVTFDGGETWENISSGLPTASEITDIAVKYNDPRTVWVTLGSFDSNNIYVSNDGGQNWTNISDGLPQIPTNCVVQNKLESTFDQIYIGTDFGVYMKNGDSAWVFYNNNLPKVVVSELDIYYNESDPYSSRLRASTYGRGLWETPMNLSGLFAPQVSTIGVNGITSNYAEFTGEITNDFGSTITESGIIVGTNPTSYITDTNIIIIHTDTAVTNGQYTVSCDTLKAGKKYYYRAYAINANGIGYGKTNTFNTECELITNLSWSEGCEQDGAFPVCFSQNQLDGSLIWKIYQGNESGYPSEAHSGLYNFEIYGSASNQGKTMLIGPTFDLTQYTAARLSFWYYIAPLFSFNDTLSLYYKSSDTGNWEYIASYLTLNEWKKVSLNLPNISDNYQFAFCANIIGARGITIDDILVEPSNDINTIENQNIQIYPNPFTNNVIIKNKNNQPSKVIITDIAGRIIYTDDFINSITVNTYNWTKGVYMVKIKSEDKILSSIIIKE